MHAIVSRQVLRMFFYKYFYVIGVTFISYNWYYMGDIYEIYLMLLYYNVI